MGWTKTGNIRGPEGPPGEVPDLSGLEAHDEWTTQSIGTLMTNIGTLNDTIAALALNDLSDVTISTPAQGEVLTRTPVGWRNLPLPSSTGWGKWTGTQAQYDALGTYNPDTLYVITGG